MATHNLRRVDVQNVSAKVLSETLEALWAQAPELRPRPDMHDYQLTYPPAVQIQQPEHQRAPSEGEFLTHALGDFEGAGYYFHFGFCQYRCRYCFHYELKTTRSEDLMSRYVDALAMEMKRFRRQAPKLKTGLYFLGGGTPTALPTHLLERFLGTLIDTFGEVPTKMSTVEAKPITATDEKLEALVQAGFRRINLGVQTLDADLYAFHHHGEALTVALDAIERARAAGFEFVNIDLMTGLEGQTPEIWRQSLAKFESLARTGAVDSVFIYPFHDDPRSRTYTKPETVPPFFETAHSDAQARALMESLGWKELGARFYRSPRHVRWELVELAKVRVNPAYGEALYHGFGNSSFSIGDKAAYLNHRDVKVYCDAVEAGGSGIAHWITMSDMQRATRDLTFDLLYSPVTRVRSREKKYGDQAMAEHRKRLKQWVALGLGEEGRLFGTFSLSPLGKLVHQQMIPCHYLPEDRLDFAEVMASRRDSGKRYRGY